MFSFQQPLLISADYEALCRPAGIDYMSFIVALEAILLVLILSKLGYDMYHYRKTGELPWLARASVCLGYDGLPQSR